MTYSYHDLLCSFCFHIKITLFLSFCLILLKTIFNLKHNSNPIFVCFSFYISNIFKAYLYFVLPHLLHKLDKWKFQSFIWWVLCLFCSFILLLLIISQIFLIMFLIWLGKKITFILTQTLTLVCYPNGHIPPSEPSLGSSYSPPPPIHTNLNVVILPKYHVPPSYHH